MDKNYYLDFENKFRGDRQTIINRLSMYDSLVELIIKINNTNYFIDIGCGRGEWLERWQKKVPFCIGLESNQGMIKKCREYGFSIIEGDALETIKNLPDESASLITIFHVIEHLNNKDLFDLILSCSRVLKKDGILIMETPSIDSLTVSSRTFYLDPTHINRINPDGLSFTLEKAGFRYNKYFFINGGQFKNEGSHKISKLLNGVAQDLLFVATKSNIASQIIFEENKTWENSLCLASSTMELAIDYDLAHDNINNEQARINQENHDKLYNIIQKDASNDEYFKFISNELKYLFFVNRILRFIFRPLFNLLRKLKRIFLTCLKFLLKVIFNFKITRTIVFSSFFESILDVVCANNKTIFNELRDKLKRFYVTDNLSMRFNNKLFIHSNNSLKSKKYIDMLKNSKYNQDS